MPDDIDTFARRTLAGLGMALALIGHAGAQTGYGPAAGHGAALPAVIYPSMQSFGSQATAQRERDGHFYFAATVNGTPLRMIFDTGASRITLRAEDAAKAGVDMGSLRYTAFGNTANGKAEFAPTTIATLTIGTITRRNVVASVAKEGSLSVNLLGQTFMSRLAGYKLDGERLVLQGGD